MFQNNYREARIKKGLSAEEAAVKLNLSVSTLYSYEQGRTCPIAETIKDMCRIYSARSDYLIALKS